MNNANSRQVAGTHYANDVQHWDWVWANDLDYFQGQITKYVARWKKKNGIQDLKKAQHFLEKYLELVTVDNQPSHRDETQMELPMGDGSEPCASYVNQD